MLSFSSKFRGETLLTGLLRLVDSPIGRLIDSEGEWASGWSAQRLIDFLRESPCDTEVRQDEGTISFIVPGTDGCLVTDSGPLNGATCVCVDCEAGCEKVRASVFPADSGALDIQSR